MFALINTFQATSDSIGSVESVHRTVVAAARADYRLQRRVRRANGPTCYLPTAIVRLRGNGRGLYRVHIPRSAWSERMDMMEAQVAAWES